nr:MAG TPA: hypothetical protein [Caudoviricetes sp.]
MLMMESIGPKARNVGEWQQEGQRGRLIGRY